MKIDYISFGDQTRADMCKYIYSTFIAECSVEIDTDFPGQSVFSTGTNTMFSWEECQIMCRDRGHKYFVWAGPTLPTNNQNNCYCKERYFSSTNFVGVVSGEASGCEGEIRKLQQHGHCNFVPLP